MDRLQLLTTDGDQRRRCVACGHEDSLASTASRAPATRLEGGLKTTDPSATSPVRILDPGQGPGQGPREKSPDGTAD